MSETPCFTVFFEDRPLKFRGESSPPKFRGHGPYRGGVSRQKEVHAELPRMGRLKNVMISKRMVPFELLGLHLTILFFGELISVIITTPISPNNFSGFSKRSFWKTVVLSPAENRWL